MFDQPKHWKWMVPGMLTLPLAVIWWKAWNVWGWGDWSVVPLGMAGVMLIAFVVNLWARVADDWANMWANVRTAMNATPEVGMFEAAKGMHPDAVKALLVHRRTVWRVKYIPLKDTVDWILDEAPNVHAGFVDFVLDRSNEALMSKRLLSEGSKQFDPEGLVTDYVQYDDLLRLMQSKLMITAAYGNQSPKFLPPWTLETIRHRFGLDGVAYEVEEGISEAMQKVMAEQKREGQMVESGNRVEVPAVISHALDGLEQTAEMRARTQVQ